MSKNIQTRKLVPLMLFSHPQLSIPSRVLMVYMTFMNDKGLCTLNTYKVCSLIGMTSGEDNQPNNSDVLAVRRARAALSKANYLKYTPVVKKSGQRPQDAYTVTIYATPPSCLEILNDLGSRQKDPVSYADPYKNVTDIETSLVSPEKEEDFDLDLMFAEAAEDLVNNN